MQVLMAFKLANCKLSPSTIEESKSLLAQAPPDAISRSDAQITKVVAGR